MADSMTKLSPSGEPEDIQARKRRRYIWRVGVFGWGGFMVVWMTLFDWYRNGYLRIPPPYPLLWSIIPNLIIFPIAGYWFGTMTWKRSRDSDL